MLGARGVDVAAWESFGQGWVTDAEKQLPLEDLRILKGDYGQLPPLGDYTGDRDLVFTWNGTTSGVRVPNADFIPADREGITICDAMGGEAAHGMLVLSPRAVERLETYTPPWPLPKIFRLTKGGKINEGIFISRADENAKVLWDWIDATPWIKNLAQNDNERSNTGVCMVFDDTRISDKSRRRC